MARKLDTYSIMQYDVYMTTYTATEKKNSNPVLVLMREDDVKGDPWGTAMAWGFGIAEVLHAAGEEVPSEMQYSPSAYVRLSSERPDEYPDCDVWDLLNQTPGTYIPGFGATLEQIQDAGRMISRYIDWCKAAGLDY